MRAFAEINRPRRYQHPRSRGQADHAAPEEHRTARSTAVSNSPSTPGITRTAAPASLISIAADAEEDAVTATFSGAAASASSGTNGGNRPATGSIGDAGRS